jgi:DnaK suppressor protein
MPTTPLSPAQIQHAADWLAHREAELDAELRAAELASRPNLGDSMPAVHDAKDDAEQAAEHSVQSAEAERDRRELLDVRAARTRLAGGLYGWCEDCEEAIDPRRLQAQPAASRCAACQSEFEARSGFMPH